MKFIRFKVFVSVVFMLLTTTSAKAIIVTTAVELHDAVYNKEPEIILNAPSFLLRSDLEINHDCNIYPHPSRSNNGGVVIDQGWNHRVNLQNATVNVGTQDPNNTITFTKGIWCSIALLSVAKDTEINLWFCNFTWCSGGSGISSLGGNYKLRVTCNNCVASDNHVDGFNLHNYGGTSLTEHIVTLNNCSAFSNGKSHVPDGCGDGITAHDPNQVIYVNGGEFYNNTKTGAAIVGGAKCYMNNVSFYDNSSISHKADVYANSSELIISDCDFDSLNYPYYGQANIWIEDSNLILDKCSFGNSQGENGFFLYAAGTCDINARNCIFTGNSLNTSIKATAETSGLIKNCTFYRNAKQIDASCLSIKENMFSSAGDYAIRCLSYNDDTQSGFNCFWSNAQNFDSATSELKISDMISDPLFADANDNDFHLRSQNGRWSERIPIKYDLNDNFFIDLLDFAKFASNWKKLPVSGEADFNGDNIVDYRDLCEFAENYLRVSTTSGWVYDDVTSPCIDAGDPNDEWAEELWPHGRRINIGAYGETNQASSSISLVGNPTDFNNDNVINFLDFAALSGKWRSNRPLLKEDIDRNISIDTYDLALFAECWFREGCF